MRRPPDDERFTDDRDDAPNTVEGRSSPGERAASGTTIIEVRVGGGQDVAKSTPGQIQRAGDERAPGIVA
jgi:hypothetical protein